MASYAEKLYNIFDSSGRIIQIEHALENIRNSDLVVTTKSEDKIVVITTIKTPEKLEIFENNHIHKICKGCYAAVTGRSSDIDIAVDQARSYAKEILDNYGRCTPDVLCRVFADKLQLRTQESGIRPLAFSMIIFGFDEEAMLYNTDTSGVCYPYKALAVGAKGHRVNKMLEALKGDPIYTAIEAYMETGECDPNNMIVCYLEKGGELTYLKVEEIEAIINEIMERK